jgi:hypothetical protein
LAIDSLLLICYDVIMSIRTEKKRINITADQDVELALVQAAKREGVPVTTKATELLRLALELEEDLALGALADGRSARGKYLSHESVWR